MKRLGILFLMGWIIAVPTVPAISNDGIPYHFASRILEGLGTPVPAAGAEVTIELRNQQDQLLARGSAVASEAGKTQITFMFPRAIADKQIYRTVSATYRNALTGATKSGKQTDLISVPEPYSITTANLLVF